MIIDTPEAAWRLARAILADLQLYNDKAIREGVDMSEQVAEGRQLFCNRVGPALHAIFEQALLDTPLRAYSGGSAPPALAHPPVPRPVDSLSADRETAARLARAIIADLTLYNGDAMREGVDLSATVAEGRQLFQRRVAPALHGVYEEALGSTPLARYAGGGLPVAAPPVEAPREYPREYPREPIVRPRTQRSSAALFIWIAVFMVVALAAVGFFAVRHH